MSNTNFSRQIEDVSLTFSFHDYEWDFIRSKPQYLTCDLCYTQNVGGICVPTKYVYPLRIPIDNFKLTKLEGYRGVFRATTNDKFEVYVKGLELFRLPHTVTDLETYRSYLLSTLNRNNEYRQIDNLLRIDTKIEPNRLYNQLFQILLVNSYEND